MPNKIKEIVVEPTKVNVGSIFKLKIKAIRYATYKEIITEDSTNTYNKLKEYTYKELKGE